MGTKKILKRITSLVLSAVIAAGSFPAAVFSESGDSVTETPVVSGNLFLQSNMRGVIITPSVDFSVDDGEENASAQLDEIFANSKETGLNTVIFNTVWEDRTFYDTNMNAHADDETDYLALAIEKAQSNDFSVYLVYDIDAVASECDDQSDVIDALVTETHKFVLKYCPDGIIIDDYYTRKNSESYDGYMSDGSGIGYENWLYDSTERYFKTVCEVVHNTNNSIPVGMMVNDVWANSSSNELGSLTGDKTQAMYDGYADTKKYVEKGYADFIIVKAYGSLSDTVLPFEQLTGWWEDLCVASGMPMYVIHYNSKLGGNEMGWGSEDQLLRQLSVAEEYECYGGSALVSYSAMLENKLNSTTTLTQYFNKQIDEQSLFEDLKMTSPSQLTFSTSEPTVDFMGTFDNNFPVYFNGANIELNEAGNFYFSEKLDVGTNTFTIKHKNKTYTYKIERKITVMKSLDSSIKEGKSLSVDGGTKVAITAVAYKGSKVTATLNGKTVNLKETTSALDNEDLNSSYATFTGKYTVPDGIIGQIQELGKIKVVGEFGGYTMSMTGASVSVNAKPEPPKVEMESEMKDENSVGTGEVVGTIDPAVSSSATVKYIKTLENYTNVYDPKTTGSVPSPMFCQLPAGTLDYYKSSSGEYYISDSGKRYKAEDVTVIDGVGIGENALVVKSVGTNGGDSFIKMSLDKHISYSIETVGNSYYSGYDGDYYLNDFAATHVYITFDNVTSVTKLPSFENNSVFSSGKWDTVTVDGIAKFRLILKLRQAGVYAGNGAYYDSDGNLVLYFPVLTNLISNYTIVIDPGHGYGKSINLFDGGAVGEVVEQEVNLAIAKELTSALNALGANAVRLKTESQLYITAQRPAYGRQYGCDIFISIHANKMAGSPEARGTEVFYFTPYSQPLADAICRNVSKYFSSYVYSDFANKNRGANYSYYWVTLEQDFPSVLVETGFVSNIQDAMALASPTHQKGIANAIANGIKEYISRSNISYAQSGSSGASGGGAAQTTQPAETTAPETSESTSEASSAETTAPESTETTDETAAEATTSDEFFFQVPDLQI